MTLFRCVISCLLLFASAQYRLSAASITVTGCPSISPTSVQVNHPSCRNPNGSLVNAIISLTTDSKIEWKDGNNQVVGRTANLLNVPSGSYTLTVTDTVSGCTVSVGPYMLYDIPLGPSVSLSRMRITPATCGNANGAILGIYPMNITSQVGHPSSYLWQDESGQIVAYTYDLVNAKPGRYRVRFDDMTICDTVVTQYLTIPDRTVTIDQANVQVTATGCTIDKGSITGIVANGATSVSWINTATNAVVGIGVSLTGMPGGTYRLLASNPDGCTAQSGDFQIAAAKPVPVSVLSHLDTMAHCGKDNGSITIQSINNNPALFSFNWLKDGRVQTAAGLRIDGLAPGLYQCISTDTNGCSRALYDATITAIPQPDINRLPALVLPDTCGLGVGSISGVEIRAEALVQYQWQSAGSIYVGSTPELLHVPAGNYVLHITDKWGCTAVSDPFAVSNVTKIIAPPVYENLTVQKGTSVVLRPAGPVSGTFFLYSTAGDQAIIAQSNSGEFAMPALYRDTVVYISVQQGSCSSSRVAVSVKVAEETKIIAPNAFTPNHDGLNDNWGIKVYGSVRSGFIRVFNRWGQMVFETSDINRRWDGSFAGKDLPTGTYVWMFGATDSAGHAMLQKGVVNIIR